MLIHKRDGSLNFFAAPKSSKRSRVAPKATPFFIVGNVKPRAVASKAIAGAPIFALKVYNPLLPAVPDTQ